MLWIFSFFFSFDFFGKHPAIRPAKHTRPSRPRVAGSDGKWLVLRKMVFSTHTRSVILLLNLVLVSSASDTWNPASLELDAMDRGALRCEACHLLVASAENRMGPRLDRRTETAVYDALDDTICQFSDEIVGAGQPLGVRYRPGRDRSKSTRSARVRQLRRGCNELRDDHGDGLEDLFLAALPNGVEPQHYATARADMICRASMRVCGGYRDRSLEAIVDKHLPAFRESKQTGRRKAGGEATIEDYMIEAEQACLADLDKADAERAKRSASRRRSRKKKRNKRRKGSGRKRKRKQKRKSSS